MTEASKTHKVTLIPGDGIGPEVTQAVVRILEATGVQFEWERFAAGAEAFEIFGEYIPAALYQSIERNGVALKGPVATPIGGGFKSINVTLRKQFDLFANFRPVKSLPSLPIIGNISTFLLHQGQAAAINKLAQRLVRAAHIDMLSPTCGMSSATPLANIIAMTAKIMYTI